MKLAAKTRHRYRRACGCATGRRGHFLLESDATEVADRLVTFVGDAFDRVRVAA